MRSDIPDVLVAATILGSNTAWFILLFLLLALTIWFLSWLLFPESETVPVAQSLEGLTGLDPVMAGKLAQFNIRSDRELMAITPRGQQELESQLNLHQGEYDRWREEILLRWRRQFLPEAFREIDEITPEPELGGVYIRRPVEVDDLTQLPAVDQTVATRMHNAGIYTFEQIHLMMPEQRACFKQRFRLAEFDFDQVPQFGVTAAWNAYQSSSSTGSVSDSREHSSGVKTSQNDTATVEQLPQAEVNPTTMAMLEVPETNTERNNGMDAAIRNNDTSTMSVSAAEEDSASDTTTQEVGLPEKFQGVPGIASDANLGAVFLTSPQVTDDLTRLPGVSQPSAIYLNQNGIYTFEQLRYMNAKQFEYLKQHFSLDRLERERIPKYGVTAQWLASLGTSQPSRPSTKPDNGQRPADMPNEVLAAGSDIIATSFASTPALRETAESAEGLPAEGTPIRGVEATPAAPANLPIPRSRFDDELGRVYTSPPPHREDLTNVEGVSGDTASQLNEAGIYLVSQLRGLSSSQQDQFRRRFDLPHFNFQQWHPNSIVDHDAQANVVPRPHFQIPMAESREECSEASSPADLQQADVPSESESKSRRPVTGFALGCAETDSTADELPDAGSPSEHHESANWSQIPGIDLEAAECLRRLGHRLFRDLENLTPQQELAIRNELSLSIEELAELRRLSYALDREIETVSPVPSGIPKSEGWLHQVRLAEVAPGVFDGQALVAYPEQVIFRGNDPSIWNGKGSAPTELGGSLAIPAAEVRPDINYVRIRRLDTRESIVTPTCRGQLFGREHVRQGWNGLNELHQHAYHLGVYSDEVPREVETTYRRGGWGFGHFTPRVSGGGSPSESHQGQGYAWNGHVIPPTAFEISVGRVGPSHGTVVFHADDPTMWNTDTQVHESGQWAVPLDRVKHAVAYLRIRRTDTGEGVIVPVDRVALTGRSEHPRGGWNGLNEYYHDAHHLGVFQTQGSRPPTEVVETTWGHAGFGFGSRRDTVGQAYGWAGVAIPRTVFEVTVYEQLPDYLRHELLIG